MTGKTTRLQHVVTNIIFAIMAISLIMVGVRLFAKMVLVNQLNMDSPALRVIADYSWGDVMEKNRDMAASNPSGELLALKEIYESAASQVTENQESMNFIQKYKSKVNALKGNLETYSGSKFMPYMVLEKLNNEFDRIVQWKLVYAREEGANADYVLKDKTKYSAVERHDMTADTQCVKEIADAAAEADSEFMYVQRPYRVKAEDEAVPWGAASYENQNADELLALLSDAGVETMDLRTKMHENGWENEHGFYSSDGHWTVPSAFLATKLIAQELNTRFGYRYRDEVFSSTNYETREYSTNNRNAWEQVEIMFPKMETSFRYIDAYRGVEYEGSFEESLLDTRMLADARSTALSLYSANRIRNSYLCKIDNQQGTANDKKVLIFSNSFSWYIASYLAMDTDEVYYSYYYDKPKAAAKIIEQIQPDCVIVIGN